jgi:hypothetical protein
MQLALDESMPYDFEDYDVEDSIRVVRELADGLIKSTAHAKHHFRAEWTDQLVSRYRERPGKPVIHLSDLPDQVIPIFSSDIRAQLQPHWDRLVSDHGSEWGSMHFRGVWDIMTSQNVPRWSTLGLLKKFCLLTGFDINATEACVIAMKSARSGKARVIKNPRLPFSLNSVEGAKIQGYMGDADHNTSAIHNLSREIHDDYKRAVLATIGEVPFTTTTRDSDEMQRTNVGVLVTMLKSAGGLDNRFRQKVARNPTPSWFFISSHNARTSYLRTLFEAEGSPTRDALKLSQATSVDDPHDPSIKKWPMKSTFSSLSKSAKRALLSRPPPLLVSTSLLLFQLGINSYVTPSKLAMTGSGCSAIGFSSVPNHWNAEVRRNDRLRLKKEEGEIVLLQPAPQTSLAALQLRFHIGAVCLEEETFLTNR